MSILKYFSRAVVLGAFAVSLSACATPEVASGIYDPYEIQNRQIHEDNKKIDEFIFRPAANSYGDTLPRPIITGFGNFAANLSLPRSVVNKLLQFKVGDALHDTGRFLVNSTFGIAGVFDPATNAGLEARDSDFGETLYVWGVGEGAYLELGFLGPSTSRHAVGRVVDFFLDPLGYVLPNSTKLTLPIVTAVAGVGSRYQYSASVDSVLHDSEDSYAQARLLYLENRRFRLGQQSGQIDEDLYDIYEESYE